MTDEKKNEAETAPAEAESKPAGKPSMMKYIMIGGGAFVLIIAIAVGVMMFMGTGHPDEAAVEAEATQEQEEAPVAHENASGGDDEIADEAEMEEDEPPVFYDEEEFAEDFEDPSVLDNITENLAFLDYQPEEETMIESDEETAGMSEEDSIDAARWLENEKAALAKREEELAARERELKMLDKKVSQKLLTLEQAEATRINNLAKLYDGMDARSVAALMANLDDKTVVMILPRMKIKNASQVLALLPPKRGAKLSRQMITIAEN